MSKSKSGKKAKTSRQKVSKNVIYACLFIMFFIIISSLILKTAHTITAGTIVGSDFAFHYELAKEYAEGKNALFGERAIETNGGPYPPLFHLLFAFAIQFDMQMYLAYFLDFTFLAIIIAVVTYVVYKQTGLKTAAMTSALMFSSVALFDRAQVIPQSIDLVFFPLAIYFFLNKKKWPFIICMLIPIYSHGTWALLLFGGLCLYSLIRKANRKENIKYNIYVLLLSLPIIIMSFIYLPGYMGVHDGAPQSGQEVYAKDPFFFFDYMGYILTIVVFALVIYLIVGYVKTKKLDYKFTELELISICWVVSMLPLLVFIIDRFCSYVAPPLAILGAGFLVRMSIKNEKLFTALLIGIAALSFLYQSFLLWAAILHGKHLFISNILKNYGIIPMGNTPTK